MKEAYLYQKLKDNKVKCKTCSHYCLIEPGKRGLCNTKENLRGKLMALNYGKSAAFNIDPIEKKPFFHFLPGTYSLSLAAVGCNFACKNCQNFDISQSYKKNKEVPGEKMSPEKIVDIALKNNLPSISYTYVEPTVFLEYALDTMKIAKKKGIKNTFVSNGFMSKESAELIIPYLDAINIDIKGFSEEFYQTNCQAKLEPVLENAKLMKKSKVWLEITTLIIPTLNDSQETFENIASFIKKELGPETPWHVSQFCAAFSWKLKDLPDTTVETLRKAYETGKETGLRYVYTGNIPGLPSEDTFCPKCKTLCIDRTNCTVHRFDKKGKCPSCSENLHLILK